MWPARIFLIVVVAGGLQEKHRQVHLRASAKTQPSKQVIYFRHCVRSTKQEVKGVDGFGFAQNFTNKALPNWQTPATWCTAQGADIMEYTGKWLASTRADMVAMGDVLCRIVFAASLDLAQAFSKISDVVNRDATTANYLLQGLGNENETGYDFTVQFEPHLFHSYGKGRALCGLPNFTLVNQEAAEILRTTAMPMGVGKLQHMNTSRYQEVLEGLESLVGHGAAGPLKDLPVPSVSADGSVKLGGAGVLRFFAQNMMYAFASGIPYTTATMEQRYSYMEWLRFYRKVLSTIPAKLVVQRACGMLKVIDDLRSPVGQNIIYFGHDGDLDALKLFFQISWEAPPWLSSATPPGSAVAFTVRSEEVQVNFLYPVFNGRREVSLQSVATTPPTVAMGMVEDRAKQLIRLYAGQSCIDAYHGAKIV